MNRRKYVEIAGGEKRPARGSCWNCCKVILRIFSILFCAADIALEVYSYVEWKTKYNEDTVAIIYFAPPAAVAIIWDLAEFITSCVRGGDGIHPGAHVGVELILWLACGAAAGLAGAGAQNVKKFTQELQQYLDHYYNAGEWDNKDWSPYSQEDVSILGKWYNITLVAGALLAAVGLIRFVLFILACIETHKMRALKRRRSRNPVIVASAYEPTTHEAQHVPLTGIHMPQSYDPITPPPLNQPYYDHGAGHSVGPHHG